MQIVRSVALRIYEFINFSAAKLPYYSQQSTLTNTRHKYLISKSSGLKMKILKIFYYYFRNAMQMGIASIGPSKTSLTSIEQFNTK